MHYLYKITNTLNGKVYIGQSSKETERWRQHKYFARQAKPLQYIHLAMAKHSVENFIYEVIAMCKTIEDANETETQLIIQYDSRNKKYGYNVSPGGDLCWNRGLPSEQQPMYGKKQSDFFKQRMSEVHTGKIVIHSKATKNKISKSNIGRISPMLGKKQSDFFKQRMSEVHSGNKYCLGKKLSNEHKSKISASSIGRRATKETKAKISAARLGKIMSDEVKQKISIAQSGKNHHNYGKHLKEETKIKISLANTGKIRKPVSEETKLKISKANTGHIVSEETRSKIGEANSIKLLPQQILDIQQSELTLEKLSKIYGVGKSTIWRVKHRH